MNPITLEIPGTPIAKARPRFARRGNFVKTYSAQETEEGRFLFEVYRQLGKGFKPMEGALQVEMIFDMPIPKSTSKKQRAKALNGELYHTKKPDIDNLEKMCYDCLNQVAYTDDSMIVESKAIKRYSDNPKTTIIIRSLENGIP
mgnify:CR=1 FL=1